MVCAEVLGGAGSGAAGQGETRSRARRSLPARVRPLPSARLPAPQRAGSATASRGGGVPLRLPGRARRGGDSHAQPAGEYLASFPVAVGKRESEIRAMPDAEMGQPRV